MKRINIYTLAPFALLFGLVACTQKELADSLLPEGVEGTPIVFTATGLNLTATTATTGTRATVYDNWENVSSVAVMIDGTVKEYSVAATADDSYATATLSSDDPHYWSTGHDPLVVTAWCPYAEGETEPPVVKVQADQRLQDDFEASDFISAENKTVTYTSPTLSFTHRTARVTVKLQAGTGITSVDDATVLLTSLSNANDNPSTITSYNSGNTYEALIAPQIVEANNPFIQVNLNGGTFTFTPQDKVELDAGSRYTYTVKVNATGLTLEGSTITAWTGGEGEDGAGEIVDYTYDENTKTYTVYTAKGLLVWNVAAQDDPSTNCTLARDIDWTDIEWTGSEWTPIGNYSNPYTGIFEGGGFTITGLTVDQEDSNYVGLIGCLGSAGEVQNLTLDNVSVTGDSYVGGVVGYNDGGTVTNCSVSGSVDGYSCVGGVVGINDQRGTVTACYASSSVDGTSYVGGVVGYNWNGDVIACYSSGSVEGYSSVGGVVGYNITGTVTACYASSSVDGTFSVGGVVGSNFDGTVTACYHALGNLPSSGSYIGGVVGSNFDGTVTACYWSSDISSGIGFNDGSDTATKVDGYDVTWEDAVSAMNTALGSTREWEYELLTGSELPTLKKVE